MLNKTIKIILLSLLSSTIYAKSYKNFTCIGMINGEEIKIIIDLNAFAIIHADNVIKIGGKLNKDAGFYTESWINKSGNYVYDKFQWTEKSEILYFFLKNAATQETIFSTQLSCHPSNV